MSLLDDLVRHPIVSAKLILRRIGEIPRKGLPKFRRRTVDDFDAKYGVETSKIVQITATASPNLKFGTAYEGAPEAAIRFAIDNCGLPVAETSFVDLGCGMGRAVIVASTYPFKSVVGVEYAPELAANCQRNVERIGAADRCTVLSMDAVEYQFPEGPVLAYFFNPFERVVHLQVLENLAKAPGPVRIAHGGPGNDVVSAFPEVSFLKKGPAAMNLYALGNQPAARAG
jgi:SAM-dependent methyltransferase